jgi:hypothetical protein
VWDAGGAIAPFRDAIDLAYADGYVADARMIVPAEVLPVS